MSRFRCHRLGRHAMRMLATTLAVIVALPGVALPGAWAQAPRSSRVLETQGWATYRSPTMGFSLSLPDGLFKFDTSVQQVNGGGVWLTDDRRARLIATSGPNTAGDTVAAYRDAIIKESYADARIDYSRVLNNGFVISGTVTSAVTGTITGTVSGGEPTAARMFYERVTFVCDGRFIYSWQMMYPVAQRQKFDRIVEAINRSYKPGRGQHGDCRQ
jgi:hypothetical protein